MPSAQHEWFGLPGAVIQPTQNYPSQFSEQWNKIFLKGKN